MTIYPPTAPDIDGPTRGKAGVEYDYTFVSTDPEAHDLFLYVDWGDDTNSGWKGPFSSGEIITLSHTWNEEGAFTIRAKVKDDIYGIESDWGTLKVTMPINYNLNQRSSSSLFFQILQRLSRLN